MSIDLSKVTGISDSRGVITEIKDSLGRVIWAAGGGKVILEVEKITSNTYAGETTYENEQFILLDIYPKTNGTVKVTYGGLTKTITDTSGAEEPNAQQVFFGTFNGISDSVTTPASGELTIEGDFTAFGAGVYDSGPKSAGALCGCIIAVSAWGNVSRIPKGAFGSPLGGCVKLTEITIPKGIISIPENPFALCDSLQSITVDPANEHYASDNGILFNKNKTELICYPAKLIFESYVVPSGVTKIHAFAFSHSYNLTTVTIPSTVESIGLSAFVLLSGTSPRTVIMMGTTPPTIDITTFSAIGTNNIVVPKGCGDAYKSAEGWSTFAEYITEAT